MFIYINYFNFSIMKTYTMQITTKIQNIYCENMSKNNITEYLGSDIIINCFYFYKHVILI